MFCHFIMIIFRNLFCRLLLLLLLLLLLFQLERTHTHTQKNNNRLLYILVNCWKKNLIQKKTEFNWTTKKKMERFVGKNKNGWKITVSEITNTRTIRVLSIVWLDWNFFFSLSVLIYKRPNDHRFFDYQSENFIDRNNNIFSSGERENMKNDDP